MYEEVHVSFLIVVPVVLVFSLIGNFIWWVSYTSDKEHETKYEADRKLNNRIEHRLTCALDAHNKEYHPVKPIKKSKTKKRRN